MSLVNVAVPESLIEILTQGDAKLDLSKFVVEAVVLSALHEGRISTGRARAILGHSFHEGQEWLKAHSVAFEMTEEEIRSEIEAATHLGRAAA